MEGFNDFKPGCLGQPCQFVLVEMMDIAQACGAALPVEQIIVWVNVLRVKPNGFPGLDPAFQARAVQELPVGMYK